MNDNRMNKANDIRNNISRQTAGSSDDKAVNVLNNTAFKNADLIIVMNEGNVIETGTHKELLEKGGYYTDLVKYQLQ